MSGKRRQYRAEFKSKLVLQVLTGEKTASDLCRQHKINPNLLNRWRNEFVERASSVFESGSTEDAGTQQIAELERLVGQLTMQLEIAKKASRYWTPDRNGKS
jgi:transposase-like protein